MNWRPTILGAAIAACAAAVGACAAKPITTPEPAAQQASASILASSSPAAGATVQGPVNTLELHFNPPARLDEVTVSGPDGLMPMMVHAVGEVAHYSLPLSGLDAGTYTVNWKASRAGETHQGSFAFTVK